MSKVHIKIADAGWILERCAREIAVRGSRISYGMHSDPSASLQYYVNYSARTERVSPIEAAFFTHSEKEGHTRRQYFEAAAAVDQCICMSRRYANELIEAGNANVVIIAPGVDLEEFRPRVRIGVVGRTYHTGRKGEALVAKVMDVPGIEWRFAGSGWPGPSRNVPDGSMAEFYNDLDYVLIPGLYEGGPMAALEALACGVPIISSDVGWVGEYPHIPFENGNVASLKRLLSELVDERQKLRSAVEDQSWTKWADQHLDLFDRLIGESTIKSVVPTNHLRADVTLFTHGFEDKTQGGPSLRVPMTAAALRETGVEAISGNFFSESCVQGTLVHLFNIWPPHSALNAARTVSKSGKYLIFSPILLDLSEIDFWQRRVMELLASGADETLLKRIETEYSEQITWSVRRNAEPGYASRIREIADLSDALIFLSERERALFEEVAGEHDCCRLIRNPIDLDAFANADPQPFRDFIGLDDFVLCVGRIEPRKNQLLLVAAAKELGLPVVLVDHQTENSRYLESILSLGDDTVRVAGRIQPNSDLLRSAYAACRVFALPSWAEGAPLAALEAAASGASLVLSNRSAEQEYFGEQARYVDPSSRHSIKSALAAAWQAQDHGEHSRALRNILQENNNWKNYAKQTATIYHEVRQRKPRSNFHAAAGTKPYSIGDLLDLSGQTPERSIQLKLTLPPIQNVPLAVVARLGLEGTSTAVRVKFNGVVIATWYMPGNGPWLRYASIPPELVSSNGIVEIEFAGADSKGNPGLVTINELQLVDLQSDELWWDRNICLSELPIGKPISLGDAGGIIGSAGCHPPEPAGMWTSGLYAEIYFRIPRARSASVQAEVYLPRQVLAASIGTLGPNGASIIVPKRSGEQVVSLPLADGSLVSTVFVAVSSLFEPSVGGTGDPRGLGVLIKSLTITIKSHSPAGPAHWLRRFRHMFVNRASTKRDLWTAGLAQLISLLHGPLRRSADRANASTSGLTAARTKN